MTSSSKQVCSFVDNAMFIGSFLSSGPHLNAWWPCVCKVPMPRLHSLSDLHRTANPATPTRGKLIAAEPTLSAAKGLSVTTRRKLTIGVAAFAALATVSACSASGGDQAYASVSSATPSASTAAAAHNNMDEMFAQRMIPHHQQAIEMSDILLAKQGIDPRVIELAGQIKAEQASEIQQMQDWLTQWGAPVMSSMPSHSMMPDQTGMPNTPGQTTMPDQTGMPNMPGQTMMPGMDGMSGMISSEDMTALQDAQGVDASKLFLQQMISHHQGAIMMAQHEINAGQFPDEVALARAIASDQQQEINTMQGILGSL